MGDVAATGAQGEAQVLDPGQKASLRMANQRSAPVEAMANAFGWRERVSAEYSQQAGQLKHQLGAVDGAGGMDNFLEMRQGQGVTESYRGQGDVGLNQAFMQQADSMGIPRESAQQMAAATVNHGEGLAELRRLQQQGYSGQQAAQAYWRGKIADQMQGRSVGQEQGFTMYRPVEGQEQGKWGQVQATWQNGLMVGLQGNTVNVASSEQLRAAWDKVYSQAISESYRADQMLGESVTKAWGNSSTWSSTTAAAQQLYKATNGSVDYMKSITSSMASSFRNSQIVDERSGQSVDKSAFAQATAGVGTPQISPVKANIEGGASWRVTTSDGKSYIVNQTAEEAHSTATNIGETHRTTLNTVRSGQYSETAQKAMTQLESIQGTKTASESATISYIRADEMREAQGQAHNRAAEINANLSRDFYHYVGEKQFGGGEKGDREAIKYLEGLAAAGRTKELDALKASYMTDRNINIESLGEGLTKVKGPDVSKAPDPDAMKARIEGNTEELKTGLVKQPNIKATDPTAQVKSALKRKNVGAVNPADIKSELAGDQKAIKDGRAEVERKGAEIKNDYTAGPLPLAAVKTAEAASDAVEGLKQLVTGGNTSQQPEQPEVPPVPASQDSQGPGADGAATAQQAQQTETETEPEPVRQEAAPTRAKDDRSVTPQQLAAEVTKEQPQPQAQAQQGPDRSMPQIPKGGLR